MQYRFYDSVASTSSTRTFIVPRDGTVTRIEVEAVPATNVDGTNLEWELSMLSSSNFSTAELSGGVLAHGKRICEVGAAGTTWNGQSWVIDIDPDVAKVEAGEKLYLHFTSSGNTTTFHTTLTVKETGGNSRRSFRR